MEHIALAVGAALFMFGALFELFAHIGAWTPYVRWAARGRLPTAMEPVPGLTVDHLRGFDAELDEAVVRFEPELPALVARRRFAPPVRRAPALVVITVRDSDAGLALDARWGGPPDLMAWGLMLFGALMPFAVFDAPGEAVVPALSAVAFVGVMRFVWRLMTRAAAVKVGTAVDTALVEMAAARRDAQGPVSGTSSSATASR